MVQKLCKRGLPLLLCVVLLASLLCVGAAAADTESNVAMNVTTTGDTVSVTVSVKEGSTISSAGLGIFFDTDLLECTSIAGGVEGYPDEFGLSKTSGFNTWVAATAYSSVEDAAREGTVGFSVAGTEDVEYAESVAFTATFTAIADGTAAFTLFEDSKGADGCNSDAIDTVSVTISDGNITINVSSVTLDQTEAALTVGESLTLTATVEPEDATDPTVTWTSDNESVATVTGGVVTAVAAGTATITATAGDCSAKCTVTVTKPAVDVTGVTLDKTEAALVVGETLTLTATVEPEDATDPTVT
ncbi:MAG: Ig-like domain-containing protein, partial [Oscillospiraceae bacterium]|nr:Ig-like domain-containing protein [Oscillospiraceae bacterium]